MPNNLNRSLLEAALTGLEAQRARIEEHISVVRLRLLRGPQGAHAQPKARTKRHLSAAGRKAIADAARRRWAAVKASKEVAATPKRRISAAGRKRIAEAQKKRWAIQKAATEQANR